MAKVRLEIRMHGPVGSIGLAQHAQVLRGIQQVTTKIAEAQDVKGADWRVVDVSVGSLVTVAEVDLPRSGAGVASALVSGLGELTEAPLIPDLFPIEALKPAEDLGRATRDHPVTLTATETDPVVAEINQALAANAKAARVETSTAIGGFYGTVVLNDARNATRLRFLLREAMTQRTIPCTIPIDDPMAQTVMGDLLQPVFVHGTIHQNRAGQALGVDVDELLEWSDGRDLQVGSFRGSAEPGDGMSSVDYVRSLRDW